MTRHSIKELQRQRDNAKSLHQQAAIELAAAEKRLHDAECRETGLMGKIAVNERGTRIAIHDVEFLCGKVWVVKGFVFNADGKLGLREQRMYPDSFKIEGAA